MQRSFAFCLVAVFSGLSHAADPKLTLPLVAPSAAPAVSIITGTPLTVHVGSDFTFQVYNSTVPGQGQIYPNSASQTADMGWFVRSGSTKYAPDFSQHPGGTATGSIGANNYWTPGSHSAVSGTGTSADPFKVTTTNSLPLLNLTATQEVTYVNGENFFRKKFTLSNSSGSGITTSVFLGADIYLAGSDNGVPQYVSNSPGGKDCGAGTYNILLIPQGSITANAYSASGYSTVWSEIGAGNLSNTVSAGCIDNGAALQWNISIPAGGSQVIEAATSFGTVPTSIITPTAPVSAAPPVPDLSPASLAVLALGMLVLAVGLLARNKR